MNELHSWALRYADRGWAVLPVHTVENGRCSCGRYPCGDENRSAGKHPVSWLVPHGVLDATTDPETIDRWWTAMPNANIGIATGPASGIDVLDVDPRNNGWESLSALKLHELPDHGHTLTCITGSKGLHLYYEASEFTRSMTLAEGLDFKTRGGYVIAPPSVHSSGGRYVWEEPDIDPSPLPTPIAERFQVQRSRPEKGSIIEPTQRQWFAELITQKCPKGQRNTTLTKIAGHLRNVHDETSALALALLWNQQQCEPPLPEAEVIKTVRGMYRRYAGVKSEPGEAWTAASLLTTEIPETPMVVEGLLPVGMTLLAGRPKRGKSWLALQLALAVASGGQFFGREVAPGKVIYLALEDSPGRIKKRLIAMGAEPTPDLEFRTEFPSLSNNGLPDFIELVGQRPKLIIVDTLARFVGGKVDQDKIGEMTDVMGQIQQLALSNGVAISLVDHHRKQGMNENDLIDDVMGSTAKTASADAIWGLYRKSGEDKGKLAITGRDVESQSLALTFDSLKHQWRAEGNFEDHEAEARKLRIIRQLHRAQRAGISEVARWVQVSWHKAQEIMEQLQDGGFVVEERVPGKGSTGMRSVYSLTLAGREFAENRPTHLRLIDTRGDSRIRPGA